MLQSKNKPQYLPTLPQELLMEILSRVPVKDLMQFRCVSKSWNTLVFDPMFIKLHLERSPKNSHILLTLEDHEVDNDALQIIHWVDNDTLQIIHWVESCSIHGLLDNSSFIDDGWLNYGCVVMGVCNGLVCLFDYYFDDYEDDENDEIGFKFWNPTTRLMSETFDLSIEFQNMKSYGFGYDDRSDTYKVVELFSDIESLKTEVKVFCLGHTCWTSTLTCSFFHVQKMENGQLVSGTINWLGLHKFDSKHSQGCLWKTCSINELIIFSYDLRSDTYRYLSMPQDLVEVPTCGFTLNVLKGNLCLSYLDNIHFVVFQMKEFGVDSSWTRLLKISYDIFEGPKIISENEDVMLLADYNRSGGKFIMYNKRDNSIDCRKALLDGKYTFKSYDYVESLVMPY